MPADFQRRTIDLQSSYDSLLKALDPTFKTLANSEVYRAKTGWITKGLNGHNGRKIRRIMIGTDVFLIPDLSKQPSIGIDTSGCENDESIIVICSIPDYEGAYVWLEKHLKLPKDLHKQELHWTKLNRTYRHILLSKFDLTLSICCDALLVIKTNAFTTRRGKTENIYQSNWGVLLRLWKWPDSKESQASSKKEVFQSCKRRSGTLWFWFYSFGSRKSCSPACSDSSKTKRRSFWKLHAPVC